MICLILVLIMFFTFLKEYILQSFHLRIRVMVSTFVSLLKASLRQLEDTKQRYQTLSSISDNILKISYSTSIHLEEIARIANSETEKSKEQITNIVVENYLINLDDSIANAYNRALVKALKLIGG